MKQLLSFLGLSLSLSLFFCPSSSSFLLRLLSSSNFFPQPKKAEKERERERLLLGFSPCSSLSLSLFLFLSLSAFSHKERGEMSTRNGTKKKRETRRGGARFASSSSSFAAGGKISSTLFSSHFSTLWWCFFLLSCVFCWSSSSPGSDVVGFVAAAKQTTKGASSSSSSKLRELETKLSITESAIAKVTQELVARGEDIREKKTKKKEELARGKEEEEEEEDDAEEEESSGAGEEIGGENAKAKYASSWGSLNNHFQFVSDTYNDYFKKATSSSLSSMLFGSGGSNSDDSDSINDNRDDRVADGRERSSSGDGNGDGRDDDGEDESDGEGDGSSSCSPSCSKYHRCVDGKCRCPLLYSGPNCTENGFEPAIDANVFDKEKVIKCAMGVNHDPFHSQYEEKYGEKADRKMRVAHILRSRFIATTKESAPDLPDLLPFNTCAVVGSNGNIENNKNYGKDIDNHDVVIRFNDAPTVGYESVVGAKTTIRIQNSDFCAKGERGSKNFGNEVCVHYTASPPDKMCERDKSKGKGGSSAGNGSCRLVYPSHRDSKYIFWYWKINKIKGIEDLSCAENQKLGKKCNALKMSAGYYGIQLALNLCGKVNLYGFGTSRETKETKHYFVKKSASWDRKGWAQRHHWSYERFCIDQFEDGLIDGLKVNR